MSRPYRVIVLEINEISWELMAPWLDAGDLPNFRRLRQEGVWGRTVTDEPGGGDGLLEPWVTWTTFYTGVPYQEHGVKVLEQPVNTIHRPRLWDVAADAGKVIGVFASSGTWPPRATSGFTVPGSFSEDSRTHPPELRPIQELNLRYTRAHAPGSKPPTKLESVRHGLRLVRLGLNLPTVARVVNRLVEIKRHPDRDWKKVSLQPVLNLPFFESLYRRYRPDFATFHTNHVAHYQHRFMRAYKPESYPDPTDPGEVSRFGGAIKYGYESADWLLGRFLKLVGRHDDTVLVVASSMGQQPYIPPKYGHVAPPTCRLKSIDALVDLLGIRGRCDYFSTMAPQWNLRIPDADLRHKVMASLRAARYVPVGKSMYTVTEVDALVVVTPVSHHGVDESCRRSFPDLPGAPVVPFDQLVVQADDTRKSGSHHPIGLLAFWGRPVRRGVEIETVQNIDVAPTLLTLLGVPVPEYMTGRNFTADLLTETGKPAPLVGTPT